MPELPDIQVYVEAIEQRIAGHELGRIRIANPFLLRTAVPPIQEMEGRRVERIRRVGKRIAIGLENDLWLVLHLMIAGRLHWREPGVALKGRNSLAAFDFGHGSLTLTEAGTKRRASLHLVQGTEAPADLDPGGLDVLQCTEKEFADRLTAANHTLKRSLTDPRIFDGIGNSYSDEILFHARLSPIALTRKLHDASIRRLHDAAKSCLTHWIDILREEVGDGFPEGVTAFRDEMAVHGKYGEPCPKCSAPVQRICRSDHETNYCANCQTGGKLLADRALSQLFGKDWPKTVEELEALKRK